MNNLKIAFALAVTVATIACGGNDDAAAEDTASAAQSQEFDTAAANAAVAPLPGTGNTAPLTVADIDKWKLGMEGELKAVQEAGVKLKAAKSATDSLDAVMGANDMTTLAAGARAAGLDPERYKFVRSTLSAAVAQLSPIEMEMDVSQIPPSMVEEMKKGRQQQLDRMKADVPAEVVEALRARAAELRKQDMTLTGERLKASGAV